MRLAWNEAGQRIFETGLDHGVFYPNTGDAVSWNGLIGVNEEGADDVVTYYIDGRPFLFLSPAKEYKATLNAYTYPDEFSDVLGIVQATSGMYVDSQRGDTFNLSYRTLIGNDIDGIEFGYKLHVVYNATVVPPENSYETITDSVNPSDFSWSISAVPEKIEGFRPTAHIIVDTRNIDPDRLADLEEMLYGTDVTPPSLPTPQEIYDLLTFGDNIIITDYGDGTWSAEGSAENVHELAGTFTIENVNTSVFDPSYYIVSTTP